MASHASLHTVPKLTPGAGAGGLDPRAHRAAAYHHREPNSHGLQGCGRGRELSVRRPFGPAPQPPAAPTGSGGPAAPARRAGASAHRGGRSASAARASSAPSLDMSSAPFASRPATSAGSSDGQSAAADRCPAARTHPPAPRGPQGTSRRLATSGPSALQRNVSIKRVPAGSEGGALAPDRLAAIKMDHDLGAWIAREQSHHQPFELGAACHCARTQVGDLHASWRVRRACAPAWRARATRSSRAGWPRRRPRRASRRTAAMPSREAPPKLSDRRGAHTNTTSAAGATVAAVTTRLIP